MINRPFSMSVNVKPKLVRITTVPISLKLLLKDQLRFISENGFEVVGISSSGEDLELVRKNEGVRVTSVEMTRVISPIRDLFALWRLYRILVKEKPNIVHTHTPKAGILGMVAASLAKVPYRLHTVAGLPLMEAKGFKRKLLNGVEKITYACATRIYPNSQGLSSFIVKQGLAPSHKVKVIAKGSSNGINTSFFSPAKVSEEEKMNLRISLGIADNDFIFIFIGRVVKDKGINELVSAFSQIRKSKLQQLRSVKLLIVGNFERNLDKVLPETEKEIKNNPNIIFMGFQSDVRLFFAISHCLVFPSYREGFPNVVMQAGAMGLPSIVTDINGCNEIIENGLNGIIIPTKDTVSLQQAMLKVLEDSEYYELLAQSARLTIVSRYEQQKVWKAILKEYKDLTVDVAHKSGHLLI